MSTPLEAFLKSFLRRTYEFVLFDPKGAILWSQIHNDFQKSCDPLIGLKWNLFHFQNKTYLLCIVMKTVLFFPEWTIFLEWKMKNNQLCLRGRFRKKLLVECCTSAKFDRLLKFNWKLFPLPHVLYKYYRKYSEGLKIHPCRYISIHPRCCFEII